MDCSALERLPWSLAAAAAALCLKKKGNLGISGLLRNLGQIHKKLDRVLVGLGRDFRSVHEVGPAPFVYPGLDLDRNKGLDLGMDLGLDPGMLLGLDWDLDLDWILDLDRDSDPGLGLL